jgi:hypothetical protein
VAYELELPPAYQKIHPVVHASFLREHLDAGDKFPGRTDRTPAPPPDLIEEEEHFWVEAFLNHQYVSWKQKRYLQWLVRWKGFGETYDEYTFDDDLKEDLTADVYRKLRAAYEQAAKIPAGTMPPDDGRAHSAKSRRANSKAAVRGEEVPPGEAAKPAESARQTRVSPRTNKK